MDQAPAKRRRWLRFSLRTLLVAVTLLCIWLAMQVNAARRQKEAVAAILKAGGKVSYEHQLNLPDTDPYLTFSDDPPPGPKWLRACLGDDFFQTVAKVQFFAKDIPESTFAQLSKLTHLREANLFSVVIVPSDSATRRSIRDADLSELAPLAKLQTFALDNANIKGPGLAFIKDWKGLRILRLDNTQVDDVAMEQIRGLTKLVLLQLSGTRITDAGLACLQDMADLENLFLDNTAITGAGFRHLNAKRLEWIRARSTRIDDHGIEQLGKMALPKLRALDLDRTKVTPEGIRELQKLLPSTKITGP